MASTKKDAEASVDEPSKAPPTTTPEATPVAAKAKESPAPAELLTTAPYKAVEKEAATVAAPAPAAAAAAPPPAAPAPTPAPTALYRVWSCGAMRRNGVTYQPGDTITLPIEIGDATVCLSRA